MDYKLYCAKCEVELFRTVNTHISEEMEVICWSCKEKEMENYRYEDGLPKQFDPLVESNSLLKESEKLFKLVFETLYKKNSDYANLDNPFSNFENSAKRVGISTEQGILVRLND